MTQGRVAKTTKGERSRVRIIATARDLLAQADLQSLTLDEVADRSGVAKSSVLWHFGSKNGLLLSVVEDVFVQLEQTLITVSENQNEVMSTAERLHELATLLADAMQKTPEANALLIAFMVNQTSDAEILDRIRGMYRQFRNTIQALLADVAGLEQGETAIAILALIDGVYLQWLLDPKQVNLGDSLRAGLSALIRDHN